MPDVEAPPAPVVTAPAPVTPPAPAPVAPVPVAPAAPAPPAPTKSVLLGGEETPTEEPFSWDKVDPKFLVKTDAGEVDKDATTAKLAKSYGEIQKRVGRPDVRPKTHAEYVIPETAKEIVKLEEPKTVEFLKGAFSHGVSQTQLDYFLGEFAKRAPELVQGAQALDATAAESNLRAIWPTDEEFDKNLGLAERALEQMGAGLPGLKAQIQNRPDVIQFLARVGAEMGEDTPPIGITPKPSEALQQLLAHPAYMDEKHPEHLVISSRVKAHYAAQPGANTPIA